MTHLSVTTTTPDRESAARIAKSAVAKKLSATAKVNGPISSFWWHMGEEGEGEEWQAVLHTTVDRYRELEAHIIAEHPWNKREVTSVQLGGSTDYLRWVEAATTD